MNLAKPPFSIKDQLRALSASLAASAFVAVTQIITRSEISDSLYAALVCFALSIPVLAGCSIQPPAIPPKSGHFTLLAVVRLTAFVSAIAVAVLGLALCFFHFSQFIGCLFLLSVFFTFFFVPRRKSEYGAPLADGK